MSAQPAYEPAPRSFVASAYRRSAAAALVLAACAAMAGFATGGSRSHEGILWFVLALWLLLPVAALCAIAAFWLRRAHSRGQRLFALSLPFVYVIGVFVLGSLFE